MQTTTSTYDFKASLGRMDELLDSSETFEKRQSIPARSALTYTNGFYVNCSAIFIDICGSSDLTNDHERPVLAKIYRAFISEAIAIMRSADTVQEVSIQGDAVWGVFNTTTKLQIDELIEVTAKLQSMINALNFKLTKKKYKNIQVGIGVDYGRALMVQAGYKGSGINDVVWMGDVVNQACHLAAYGNETVSDFTTMISEIIYNNLSPKYQKLFEWNAERECYHADLYNVLMDAWLKEQNTGKGLFGDYLT